ncbi:F-box domain-containing protein [Lineolata rhizophorae]|uniref:F-box domain-containing protein n=1 Tax=Lineolata rhizophorae TaxID=578093 RepID=A0A6A6P615_9PEZI|nr:F-box domain-containing protein [Lineolata rhizophorae]
MATPTPTTETSGSKSRDAFAVLPDELVHHILAYLSSDALAIASELNRRFHRLTLSPLLWRAHCLSYRYWHPRHRLSDKLAAPAGEVDWCALFAERQRIDRRVRFALDGILAGQQRRILRMRTLLLEGYDAKDELLRQCNVGKDEPGGGCCGTDECDDVLARRYYADAMLQHINRKLAVEEWERLGMARRKREKEVTLEGALAAYEMFILGQRGMDFDEISRRLDVLAEEFSEEHMGPNGGASLSTREIALKLVWFMREEKGFQGVRDEKTYRALKNSFIGIALEDENHEALPLITVAVFCSVARRVGLNARPCGFPYHIYAIVDSPPGRRLDDTLIAGEEEQRIDIGEGQQETATTATADPCGTTSVDEVARMYLDPFRTTEETPLSSLTSFLSTIGVARNTYASFLGPATNREMVRRTARNVMSSVQELRHLRFAARMPGAPGTGVDASAWVNIFPDVDTAFYAALWATFLLGMRPGQLSSTEQQDSGNDDGEDVPVANPHGQGRTYLPYLSQQFQTHFPEDVTLIEQHAMPHFVGLPQYEKLRETVQAIMLSDAMARPRIGRSKSSERSKNVRYRVGDLFRHKRYGYVGVITGWDPTCDHDESWIQAMDVDSLQRGRQQSFYHVLVEDKSNRYVAEENIDLVRTPPPQALLQVAGRHFKRWDKARGVFVSNVRDEYPDD